MLLWIIFLNISPAEVTLLYLHQHVNQHAFNNNDNNTNNNDNNTNNNDNNTNNNDNNNNNNK